MVQMQQALVMLLNAAESNLSNTLIFTVGMIIGLLCFIVMIWILSLVYKLVRRGEAFNTQFSKYLETTGKLLVAIYLIQLVGSYIITNLISSQIHLAHHTIVFKNDCNSMYIIMGLTLMVISQIMLIAKDMKEEQELTI